MSSSVTIGVEQEYFLVDPQCAEWSAHRGEKDVALSAVQQGVLAQALFAQALEA